MVLALRVAAQAIGTMFRNAIGATYDTPYSSREAARGLDRRAPGVSDSSRERVRTAACVPLRDPRVVRRPADRNVTGAVSSFRAALGRRLALLEAMPAQHVGYRFVALVAGVLVDQLVLVLERNHHRPRRGPRGRIGDGELVVEHIGADARESLGEAQVFVRAH